MSLPLQILALFVQLKKVNVQGLEGVRLLILFIYGEIYGDLLKLKSANRLLDCLLADAKLYSDWESNPDFRFRKPTFYPLNYQSITES